MRTATPLDADSNPSCAEHRRGYVTKFYPDKTRQLCSSAAGYLLARRAISHGGVLSHFEPAWHCSISARRGLSEPSVNDSCLTL